MNTVLPKYPECSSSSPSHITDLDPPSPAEMYACPNTSYGFSSSLISPALLLSEDPLLTTTGATVVGTGYPAFVVLFPWLASHTQICPLSFLHWPQQLKHSTFKASSLCQSGLLYGCNRKWQKLYQYNCTSADLKHPPQSFYQHKPLKKERGKKNNHPLSWQSYASDVTGPKGAFTLKLGGLTQYVISVKSSKACVDTSIYVLFMLILIYIKSMRITSKLSWTQVTFHTTFGWIRRTGAKSLLSLLGAISLVKICFCTSTTFSKTAHIYRHACINMTASSYHLNGL